MPPMSQNPNAPVFVSNLPPTEAASNTLGLAGFITSLVGIAFTGGVLCPVGLILSLIALSRRPRGFAVAGVVLGALGSCGGCLVLALFTLVGGAALAGALAVVVTGGTQGLETLDHMMQVDVAIEAYERKHGELPAELSQLGLPEGILKDGWGHPLEYRLDRGVARWNWKLRTPGPDGVLQDSDLTFEGDAPAPAQP